jgi:hypothetical protein
MNTYRKTPGGVEIMVNRANAKAGRPSQAPRLLPLLLADCLALDETSFEHLLVAEP